VKRILQQSAQVSNQGKFHMEKQIILTLPDSVLDRAASLAAVVSRPVEKILRETLEIALPEMGHQVEPPVSSLSDDEVVRLTKAQMESRQNARLSKLLDKQQSGILTELERSELYGLFQTYLRLWLRQSEALVEAVRRGLSKPLSA
jgi:predicted DNA-binding protein